MGYHADIGGGNKYEGLARVTLVWMVTHLSEFVDFDFEPFKITYGSPWRGALDDTLTRTTIHTID